MGVQNKRLVSLVLIFCLFANACERTAESPSKEGGDYLEIVTSKLPDSCDFLREDAALQKGIAPEVLGAVWLTCLDELIVNGGLTERESSSERVHKGRAFDLYYKIMSSGVPEPMKLNATTSMVLGVAKAKVPSQTEYFNWMQRKFLSQLGTCTTSILACEHSLQVAKALAQYEPILAEKFIAQERNKVDQWPNSLVQRSFSVQFEASLYLAKVYRYGNLNSNGKLPYWMREFDRVRARSEIWKLADEIKNLSLQFEGELFIPLFSKEVQKYLQDGEETAKRVAKNMEQQLGATELMLRAVFMYFDRIGNRGSLSAFLKGVKDLRDRKDFPLIKSETLRLFTEVETRLATRHEWIAEMEALNKSGIHRHEKELDYAKKIVEQLDSNLKNFLYGQDLNEIYDLEQTIASKSPVFDSAFLFFEPFMESIVSAKNLADEYKETQSNKTFEKLQSTLMQIEAQWFLHKCLGKYASKDDRSQVGGIIKLPFHGFELEGSICGSDFASFPGEAVEAEIIARFYKEFSEKSFRRSMLIEVGIPALSAAIVLVSAGLASSISAVIMTRAGSIVAEQTIAAAFARFLTTGIAKRVTTSFLNAAIFTLTMKSIQAGMGVAPFWDSKKGVWGNFGKPILVATAIFIVLPVTHVISSGVMSKLATHSITSTPLRLEMTQMGVGLAVDTLTFVSIDYVHRSVEKIFNPKLEVIRDNDLTDVGANSLFLAAVFKSPIANVIFKVAGKLESIGYKVAIPEVSP